MDPPKKKESWWKRWVPKCGGSSSKNSGAAVNDAGSNRAIVYPEGDVLSLECQVCREKSEVANSATSFVCKTCHKVHRIFFADDFGSNKRRLSIVSTDKDIVTLVRTSSTTFQPVGDEPDLQARPGEAVVPQCQVCMDGAGDVVLLPCTHGAICESCAKHIARNLSVGGNHCVKCRQEIKDLIRLNELYTDHATGVTVEVPQDSIKKGPPKVPPPPGLNKGKERKE
jgi:hypothetical protein